MRARRKGTDNPFTEIDKVQLKGTDIMFNVDVMEFEHDTLSTELKTYDQIEEEKHWEKVREKVAIAAMQAIISNPNSTFEGDFLNVITKNAVTFADALVEQLKQK